MTREHLLFARVGEVSIQVFSADPTDEEWDEVLHHLAAFAGKRSYSPVLVSSERGGPNAAQRRRLSEVLKQRPQRAAILTRSRLVHGILTAIRWFDPTIQTLAFEPAEFDAAATYLEITPLERGEVLATLERLRKDLGLGPLLADAAPADARP